MALRLVFMGTAARLVMTPEICANRPGRLGARTCLLYVRLDMHTDSHVRTQTLKDMQTSFSSPPPIHAHAHTHTHHTQDARAALLSLRALSRYGTRRWAILGPSVSARLREPGARVCQASTVPAVGHLPLSLVSSLNISPFPHFFY